MRSGGSEVVYPLEMAEASDALKYKDETMVSVSCESPLLLLPPTIQFPRAPFFWPGKALPLADRVADRLPSLPDRQFPKVMEEFIRCFEPDPSVTSLEDIIAWNEAHAEEAMPEREQSPPLCSPRDFFLAFYGLFFILL